LTDRIC